jgi:hypothetical protein
MPDNHGYPTDDELDTIRMFDPRGHPRAWFDLIKTVWWYPEWGWREEILPAGFYGPDRAPQRTTTLYLSTGGWSGNEEIIDYMHENPLWLQTWESTRRGGHYMFTFTENAPL